MATLATPIAPDGRASHLADATEPAIVLRPVAHPELDEIRIDDGLFAIGRDEAPFDRYPAQWVGDLSRRHARIFTEFGAVYVADLGSKNGTILNGHPLRQRPARLRDGDLLSFGRELSFRVHLGEGAGSRAQPARLLRLVLTPERGDLGLEPIVIGQFPFLVSKSNDFFARHKAAYPHQLAYLSRRHAHVFLKHGEPYVEDLGSTNGTFVAGKRLDEHAVPLQDGDTLAFGGHHFVYRVTLERETASDDTKTRFIPTVQEEGSAAERTTFVAAADSFLDIFCVDPAAPQEDEVNAELAPASNNPPALRRGARALGFIGELRQVLADGESRTVSGAQPRRLIGWGLALALIIGVSAALIHGSGGPQREIKQQLAAGAYAEAAETARAALAQRPDDLTLQTLGKEALLKAWVPAWLGQIKAKDFDRAATTLAAMKQTAANNADALPLLEELAWIGQLERLIARREAGQGAEPASPLLKHWNDDPQRHLRALAAIAAQVPEFRDWYGTALGHLRKLQSDEAMGTAAHQEPGAKP